MAYGFNFGSGVASSRNRKFGDCSIASTTSCAPFRKSGSRAPSALRSAPARPARAAGGRPSARTRARTARGRQPTACTESARAYRRRGTRSRASFSAARAVGLDQQRRKTLRLRLIPEAVDEILGRKLVRRAGLVAQQIANRVVVLAVRQPPQFGVRGLAAPAPRSSSSRYVQRGRKLVAGKLRQALQSTPSAALPPACPA